METALTVVIPAFNEAESIGVVVRGVKAQGYSFLREVIVVDDGSNDETGRLAQEAGARVIRHNQNLGYGASLKTGIRAAQTEFVLTMDADGQHRSEDIAKLMKAASGNGMVVGQRTQLLHSTLWRMPGKWMLGVMANYLTNRKIPDLNSGFRLLRKDLAAKYLHLCPQGFSLSTTMTMIMFNRGYSISYVPIEVNKRVGKSTVSVATGLDTIILILRIATLFNPLRIFVPLSILIGLGGLIWAVPFLLAGKGVSVGALLGIVTSVLLFALGLLSDQISQLRLERFE